MKRDRGNRMEISLSPLRTSGRVSDALQNNSPYWLLACYAVMVLSFLRGIRLPSSWTYSHYLMNYDFGFTKRGFLGSIVEYVGIPYLASYEIFTLFSIATLFGNLLLLAVLLRDFVRNGNVLLLSCSMIFVCSPTLPSLANFIGYSDQIGMFVALMVLKIRHFWQKLTFTAPSFLVALLVHEVNFILFFPVVFISLLFSIKKDRRTAQFLALVSVSLSLLGFTYLISSSNLTEEQSLAMHDGIQAEIGIPLHKSAFDVLHRDVADNFNLVRSLWIHPHSYIISLTNVLLVVLPVIAACLGTATFFLLGSDRNRYIIPLTISTSLSPLILSLIAKDTNRWFIWSSVTSFFVLYAVWTRCQNLSSFPTLTSCLSPLLATTMFIVSITSSTFFDGYTMQHFPFVPYQKYITELISDKVSDNRKISSDPNTLAIFADPITVPPCNIQLQGHSLFYSCDEFENIHIPFFLYVIPSDIADLPESRQRYGFDEQDFRFVDYARKGRPRWVAERKLPEYDIAAIRTGQHTTEGRLWEAAYYFRGSPDSKARGPGAPTSKSGQRNVAGG